MRETKRRLEAYSFFDRTGIAAHLTKMAEKGWMIDKLGNFGWVYRRIEPKRLTFTVTYYPKASNFDPEPSDGLLTFYEFCDHAGWKLAAASAQMQIFYNEAENPVPIETDPVLEVETIHRTAKKGFLWMQLLLLAVALLNGALLVSQLRRDPVGLLASNSGLFSGLVWVVLLLLCTVELVGYFLWHARAVKAAEQGEFLAIASSHRYQSIALYAVLALGVLWLAGEALSGSTLRRVVMVGIVGYMFLTMLLTNVTKNTLQKRRVSAGVNRTVTFVVCFAAAFGLMGALVFGMLFASDRGWLRREGGESYEVNGHAFTAYLDELPLTVEDLTGLVYDGYTRERTYDESLVLGQFEARQHPRIDAEDFREMPQLSYTITAVKAPFLYGFCRDGLLEKQNVWHNRNVPEEYWELYQPVDAGPWGAAEAYQVIDGEQDARNRYLLCYESCMVEIRFDWEPTAAQKAMVGERLGSTRLP